MQQITMDQKTASQIVARVLGGEKQAYALLVDEYKQAVYHLAYRMTHNTEDARDLAQESFLRAYQNLSHYDSNRSFFTWLYTLSLNVIRNFLKKRNVVWPAKRNDYLARELQNAQNQQTFSEEVLQREKEEMLEICLARLSAQLRELIVLRFYQGLSFEEIAEITGLSQSAVKMRTYRSLEKLQKYFEEM